MEMRRVWANRPRQQIPMSISLPIRPNEPDPECRVTLSTLYLHPRLLDSLILCCCRYFICLHLDSVDLYEICLPTEYIHGILIMHVPPTTLTGAPFARPGFGAGWRWCLEIPQPIILPSHIVSEFSAAHADPVSIPALRLLACAAKTCEGQKDQKDCALICSPSAPFFFPWFSLVCWVDFPLSPS